MTVKKENQMELSRKNNMVFDFYIKQRIGGKR